MRVGPSDLDLDVVVMPSCVVEWLLFLTAVVVSWEVSTRPAETADGSSSDLGLWTRGGPAAFSISGGCGWAASSVQPAAIDGASSSSVGMMEKMARSRERHKEVSLVLSFVSMMTMDRIRICRS